MNKCKLCEAPSNDKDICVLCAYAIAHQALKEWSESKIENIIWDDITPQFDYEDDGVRRMK